MLYGHPQGKSKARYQNIHLFTVIKRCMTIKMYMFWHLVSLSPWGWLAQNIVVETSASCFPILKLYTENLLKLNKSCTASCMCCSFLPLHSLLSTLMYTQLATVFIYLMFIFSRSSIDLAFAQQVFWSSGDFSIGSAMEDVRTMGTVCSIEKRNVTVRQWCIGCSNI